MAALKQDVFSDVVFCFTPKGDVVELPAGSTALDFAYYIHTEIGHQCAGARINRKIAPIRTEIQMGDVVEIQRSRTAHPTRGWLKVAKTARALSKIRHWLKTEDFEENRQKGFETLLKTLRARGIDMTEEEMIEKIQPFFPNLRVNSWPELMAEIGFGAISPLSVSNRLAPEEKIQKPKQAPSAANGKEQLVVEGLRHAMTRLSNCCKPMPGDSVIGFITRGRGVSVHRQDCANLKRIVGFGGDDAGARLIAVRWQQGRQPLRRVTFKITSDDRPGLLRDVSNVFADFNLNIIETNSKTNIRNQRAIIKLLAMVANASQIDAVLNALMAIDGVVSATKTIRAA